MGAVVSTVAEEVSVTDEFTGAVQALARALGDPTRREIYLFVRRQGSATAQGVARQFDLHPNVARHHLDRLAASGYVEIFTARDQPHVGRPSKQYRLLKELSLIDGITEQAALLGKLLGRLISEIDPKVVEVLAYDVGFDYGRDLALAMNGKDPTKSVSASLKLVADALTRTGFSATATVRGGEFLLDSHTCPFGQLVADHPVLCATERGIVDGLMQGLVRGTSQLRALSERGTPDPCRIQIRRS